jgi:crotonobetainyl-CoA:carnitine CoA-transferase CaiB-like acyl-CoA transferase
MTEEATGATPEGAGGGSARGPLAGIRVVDLTTNLSGPFATMILAQQGADVIKIERPPGGDILRNVGSRRGGVSSYFVNTNWGKRSVALDLNDDADKATFARLVAHADVVVENFRPNVMPGLGFAADDLVARHPRLIYVAIRGFPAGSRLANAPTYDHVIQATTGFAANQAHLRTGEPQLVQQGVTDKIAGLTTAQAVTAALFDRERTGHGQVLEVPMLHAALAFLWPDVASNTAIEGDFDRVPPQSRTYRLTATADGYLAMITVTTPQWEGLLRTVGRDDLVGNPDYASPHLRGKNGAAIMKDAAATIATMPTAEVVARLAAEGVPCAAVVDLDDVPEVVEELSPGFLVHEEHPQLGAVIHPRPAVEFRGAPEPRPAPAVGEHTAEVLAELDALEALDRD